MFIQLQTYSFYRKKSNMYTRNPDTNSVEAERDLIFVGACNSNRRNLTVASTFFHCPVAGAVTRITH